ncbi:hypothetical protein BLA29_000222 [Euroglyphus maynei]|uniref:tRNA pseudouridine(55) synthase n=1 Tax=Euroglyphus maynei TaxID=6958 RepID=A0A1Y3BVU7_EURMA|nr:hypothetical protein BLA29_000222 [Euroglyphus maynei]
MSSILNQESIEKIIKLSSEKSLYICFTCINGLSNRQLLNILEKRFINNENKQCQSCLDLLDAEYMMIKVKEIAGHVSTINEFQLHICLPFILTLRHLYFCKLFELNPEQVISVKDVIKTFITIPIEKAIHAQHSIKGNYVIELKFDHAESKIECEKLMQTCHRTVSSPKRFKSSLIVNHAALCRLFENPNNQIVEQFQLIPIETVCTLDVSISHEPIYIAGRYIKLSRNLSQTPWFVNDNRFKSSVQEKIFSGINVNIKYSDIKFSSSGREDVDVRMLGIGRPFMVEIFNPQWSNEDVIAKIKEHINQMHQDIRVRDLQFVPRNESQKFLKQGEQEKSKTYQAICCIDRPFTEADMNILNSVKDLVICQTTPIRVLHRRTLSDRHRTVHSISARPLNVDELDDPEWKEFLSQMFCISIVTEAGTYIKEFVHSDFGRTRPNIGSLLGNCRADIISLDVLEVKLDWPPIIDD